MPHLEAVAAKLGVGSQELLVVLSRQAIVEGWIRVGIALACFLLAALFWRLFKAVAAEVPKRKEKESEAFAASLLSFIFFIACLAFTGGFVFNLITGLHHLLNPQYYALRLLLALPTL
jgi:cytochrome b561